MQLLRGCFPDVVVQAEKNKKQSWLCVTAFVSISPHFFGISAGGVILFFSRWQFSRKGDAFQSSTLVWLTHFLPGAKTTILNLCQPSRDRTVAPLLAQRMGGLLVSTKEGRKQSLPGCSHGSVYNVEEGTDASVHSPFGRWYRNISSPAAWLS